MDPLSRTGDIEWKCPMIDPLCRYKTQGDDDSPYADNLCPTHQLPVIRVGTFVKHWQCPHGDHYTASNEAYYKALAARCPTHDLNLEPFTLDEAPDPTAPNPGNIGDMWSFTATERAMDTLSTMRRVVVGTHGGELWADERIQAIIASEWDLLKQLMKGAGFE